MTFQEHADLTLDLALCARKRGKLTEARQLFRTVDQLDRMAYLESQGIDPLADSEGGAK